MSLGAYFKISKEQSPKIKEERDHIKKVPYASTIRSLIYVMVCTRLDIVQVVGVVSRYMNNYGKMHYETVKWILKYFQNT